MLTRDGTAKPGPQDQILRRKRVQGNINFPCSADHEQDWQPYYPFDPHSRYMCDHTYIHAYGVIGVVSFRSKASRCWQGQSPVARSSPLIAFYYY